MSIEGNVKGTGGRRRGGQSNTTMEELDWPREVFPLGTRGESLHFSMFKRSSPHCLPLISIFPWHFEDPKQSQPEVTEEV